MPSSNEKLMTNEEWQEMLAKIAEIKKKRAELGIPEIDPQVFADALNAYHNSPEFTARYKKYLLSLPRDCLTPVAKADLKKMLAEEKKARAKTKVGKGQALAK